MVIEYMQKKGMCNATFGMMCQAIFKEENRAGFRFIFMSPGVRPDAAYTGIAKSVPGAYTFFARLKRGDHSEGEKDNGSV